MASIQRRGKTWRAVIRRTGYSSQIKSFPLKAAAEAWARKVERDMDMVEFVDRKSYRGTCIDLMERYAKEVSPTKKGERWEQTRLKKLMRAPWAAKPANDVTKTDIEKWKASLTVSNSTIRREMVLAGSVFSHAKKKWHLPVLNPFDGVCKPLDGKARDRRPSTTELGALRTHFQKKPGMLLLMELAIETAMRLGELCSLQWRDVHLKERYIHLRDTKNGQPRNVPLSPAAVAMLEGPKHVGRLFSFSAGTAGIYWREACKVLGIEDLHFHDLRHEATTRLAEKLTNVLELAAVTGHRDLKMLNRYYNPTPTDLAMKLA